MARSDVLVSGDWAHSNLDIPAYPRIGERSSHTRFVLQEPLGHKNLKNYDSSWTEYGSLVGAPIELGS